MWKYKKYGKYANLVCCINCPWSVGNVSLCIRYSYLFTLLHDNADICAISLLISNNVFSNYHDCILYSL